MQAFSATNKKNLPSVRIEKDAISGFLRPWEQQFT
jgi:hypothetical protein